MGNGCSYVTPKTKLVLNYGGVAGQVFFNKKLFKNLMIL